MTDITTQDQPLDKRCRETHPERITVGNVTFERNDVVARRYGISERSLNRGDKSGAPFKYFGNIKYRPMPDHDNFVLRSIQQFEPSLKRRARRFKASGGAYHDSPPPALQASQRRG